MTPERMARARALIELTRTTPYGAVASAGDTEAVDLLEDALNSIDWALAVVETHSRTGICVCRACSMRQELHR